MTHDGLERGIDAIMEVRRRQLDVAQRRHAEREAVGLAVRELAPPQVERRAGTHARSELRRPRVRKVPAAEERTVVTAGAGGQPIQSHWIVYGAEVAEEEQRAALRLRR